MSSARGLSSSLRIMIAVAIVLGAGVGAVVSARAASAGQSAPVDAHLRNRRTTLRRR